MLPINSEQELKNLKEQYGEGLFTMKETSVEIIEKFDNEKCEKIGQLFKRLQSIFIIENSATIKNPSDIFLLDFFINMEIAKLLDKAGTRNNTVTLKEFTEIIEINEIVEKHKDKIEKITKFRNKSLAHADFEHYSDVLPVGEYLSMLREFSAILCKILLIISEIKKDELNGHCILSEISKRLESVRSFYSCESNLNKKLEFKTVEE